MGSTQTFTEGELSRKLEKVFEIFARAQEDWAVAHDLNTSIVDTGSDLGVSARGGPGAA